MGNVCCPGPAGAVQLGDVDVKPTPKPAADPGYGGGSASGYGGGSAGAYGGGAASAQPQPKYAKTPSAPRIEVKSVANPSMPPGRVRHLFKTLDKDNSGGLSMQEVVAGFAKEFGVSQLAPHVTAAMKAMIDEHGTITNGDEKVVTTSKFSRFYAEVLFKHFDKDNNGTLELGEVERALKHIVKPNAAGERVAPTIAFPPQYYDDAGEIHLPMQWFWATFTAME